MSTQPPPDPRPMRRGSADVGTVAGVAGMLMMSRLSDEQRRLLEEHIDVHRYDDEIPALRAALAELGELREIERHLHAVMGALEAEAKATLTANNALENFSDPSREVRAHEKALQRSADACQAARAAIRARQGEGR